MKKYFIRFAATLLFIAFLPMVSNFCVADFSFFITSANAAPVSHDKAIAYDVCSQGQANVFAAAPGNNLEIQNHHSIAPCCTDSSSPTIISQNQFDKIGKFIPVTFFAEKPLVKLVSKKIVYSLIIASPPELSSIKATILRI